MRTVTVGWKIDDREVEIEAEMAPAEYDVGIPAPYPVGLHVVGEDVGQDVIERLMDDESLASALANAYYERENSDG